MRRSLAATLVALSLALTLAPAVVSAADEGKARATVPDASLARTAATTDSERATTALARAKALFGGTKSGEGRNGGHGDKSGKNVDATMVMRDLFTSLDDLSPADRKVAHGILARPTDGASDPYSDGYLVPSEKKCKGNFCMHWVTTTEDAPPSQTWVNQMLSADEQGLEEGSQEVRLPPAGLRREPRRQRQVRRVPRPDRRRGPLRVLRPRAPQARLPVAGVRLLRPRQRLRRSSPSPRWTARR